MGSFHLGCIAIGGYLEPQNNSVYCVSATLMVDTVFEQKVWAAPDSYPWACHIYQVQSEALQFLKNLIGSQ
ncbi:pleckstrin-like protein [Thalictrum thalictroides]|uniref:Pleckstrin-like protein n=1 Tax=Thalictrum thalictroides TaxID=46969 RepID=A0A7J6UUP0_THATH|nr:pleckstrin-like protein [Thalictrum thalictroides]